VVKLSLFLGGVQSRWKYLTYGSPAYTFLTFTMVLRDLLKAMTLINTLEEHSLLVYLRRIDLLYQGLNFLITGTFFLLQVILPVALYDYPVAVNWVYLLSYTMYAIYIWTLALTGIHSGGILKKMVAPILGRLGNDKEFLYFTQRVNELIRYGYILTPAMVPLFLLPIWVGVSSSHGGFGTQYYFFFEFTYLYIIRCSALISLARFALRRTKKEQGANINVGLGRFSVEELNGFSPQYKV